MGLKTLVREDLKLRGIDKWTVKAPQAVPNRKDAERLAARQRGHTAIMNNHKGDPGAFKMPGSYRK